MMKLFNMAKNTTHKIWIQNVASRRNIMAFLIIADVRGGVRQI